MITLVALNALSHAACVEGMLACCGARAWAEGVTDLRPFVNHAAMHAAADGVFERLSDAQWREAFAAHPQIGQTPQGAAHAADWARDEQLGAAAADAATRAALAQGNVEYAQRFGFIFLVCATGKSASEMLALQRERLANEPRAELRIAAAQQQQITHLRLNKWVQA